MSAARYIAIVLLSVTSVLHAAEAPDSALAAKAARAFDNSEWAGATALYMLLSDSAPDAPLPYARMLLAQEMRSDSVGSRATVERALAHSVPVDSLLEPVCAGAFALHSPEIYERLLLRLQSELPWLHRVLDIRLLRYYTMRRDPANMIAYSRRMLAGNPADTDALATLAEGALLTGDTATAVSSCEKILDIAPASYSALASLATTLAPTDPAKAAQYARRALAIHPNTALEALLRSLE